MVGPWPDLGPFKLHRRLGEGGFGVVYEARDVRYGARVALKVLRRSAFKDIFAFKREFRSLSEIVHPNLVRLYELSNVDDTWFLSMELLDGVTFLEHVSGTLLGRADVTAADDALAEPVVSAKADPAPLLAAARQLALAVAELHAEGKLHRDLKPSNILVTRDGRLVVLDFGLVTEVGGSATPLDAARGTPGYMAPEQALRGAATEASDWYGFGAILRESLHGSLLGGPRIDLAPELSALNALSANLLAREPAERPSQKEIFATLGLAQPRARARAGVLRPRQRAATTPRSIRASDRTRSRDPAGRAHRCLGGREVGARPALSRRARSPPRRRPGPLRALLRAGVGALQSARRGHG